MATDRGGAWVVLAASVCGNYLHGVLVYLVGVIHAELLEKFQEDVTTTSWAGAVYSSLASLAAPLSSWIVSSYDCRTSTVVGGVLLCVGFAASAFATSVLQLLVTYGFIAGIGAGLTYTPSIMTIAFHFNRLRALASGISLAGVAVGILSGSLIAQSLIDTYGMNGAFLLIGGIALNYCVFGMFYFPTPYEGKRMRRKPSQEVLKDFEELTLEKNHQADKVTELKGQVSKNDENGTLLQETALLAENSRDCDGEKIEYEMSRGLGGGVNNSNRLPGQGRISSIHASADVQLEAEEELNSDALNAEDVSDDAHVTTHLLGDSAASPDFNGHAENKLSLSRDTCAAGSTLNSDQGEFYESEDPFRRRKCCKTTLSNHFKLSKKSEPHPNFPSHTDNERSAAAGEDLDLDLELEDTRSCKVRNTTWSRIRTRLRRDVSEITRLARNWALTCHCVSLFFIGLMASGVYLHLPAYAKMQGTSAPMAATLFVGVGIAGLVARLGVGFLATVTNVRPLLINAGAYGGQMAFSAMFGASTGGIYSLINVLTVDLVGLDDLTVATGVEIFMIGVGYIIGPPLAGVIVDSGGTYQHSFVFLGATMILACLLDVLARVVQYRHGDCQVTSQEAHTKVRKETKKSQTADDSWTPE
ncbi:hypothetical protein BaRGS_00026320 [Batillaria attramentaria]|uniref:Uncharacterized protein n=1 Tax=Batillaria attramentaria TaxID=370345 RepID=A0ABD0K687_9CAEN